MPVTYVCSTCGSDDVSRDAWAEWSLKEQRWALRTAFDYAHCHRCDTETNLVEVQLHSAEKVILQSQSAIVAKAAPKRMHRRSPWHRELA